MHGLFTSVAERQVSIERCSRCGLNAENKKIKNKKNSEQ